MSGPERTISELRLDMAKAHAHSVFPLTDNELKLLKAHLQVPSGPKSDAQQTVEFLTKMLTTRFARSSPIEEKLQLAGMGKRPLPTAEECLEWAAKLGVPDEFRLETK